ncbi:hypothetical protein K239x_22350 [Planctomycetes bacterium K23_9]|uniref:Uncharacterized protein n=1 Tax=Stieleria marina TaxID=1930275 RepID=A0A517NT44_9BACT|nr:hypothetical protein K239x_22350 [Planctomycetes bacterium K23_9]
MQNRCVARFLYRNGAKSWGLAKFGMRGVITRVLIRVTCGGPDAGLAGIRKMVTFTESEWTPTDAFMLKRAK